MGGGLEDAFGLSRGHASGHDERGRGLGELGQAVGHAALGLLDHGARDHDDRIGSIGVRGQRVAGALDQGLKGRALGLGGGTAVDLHVHTHGVRYAPSLLKPSQAAPRCARGPPAAALDGKGVRNGRDLRGTLGQLLTDHERDHLREPCGSHA